MAKLMAVGMPLKTVVEAVTVRPMAILGLPTRNLLASAQRAELTVFDVVDADLEIADSMGAPGRLDRLIEPRWTIVGSKPIRASRHGHGSHEGSGGGRA
jgi:dihydroorotase